MMQQRFFGMDSIMTTRREWHLLEARLLLVQWKGHVGSGRWIRLRMLHSFNSALKRIVQIVYEQLSNTIFPQRVLPIEIDELPPESL